MTADPGRRLSSMDVLDADDHARLDGWGNRAVLTRPAPPRCRFRCCSPSTWRAAPEAVAISCGGRSLTYRELEEAANRLAHLLAVHGVGPGAVCGAAVFPVRRGGRGDAGGAENRGGLPADRPGAARRPGSSSCSMMPRRSPRSPPRGCRRGWTGATWRSSISTTPAWTANPAAPCRRRRPMTSPTSSTRRALPVSPKGWPSPTTM